MENPASRQVVRLLCLLLLSLAPLHSFAAKFLDSGIDPYNLGKGDWIYVLSDTTAQMGGYIPSVTNVTSLMSYEASQGMQYIIIKAGTGATDFPSAGSPQVTTSVINAAHNAGLKIFAYTRSMGLDIPGEIALATNYLAKGCDGFVIDAESEWEAGRNVGSSGPALATQLCQGIKNAFPNRFLGHSPAMYISLHSSFPFKEFGYYCDATMPQCYWVAFGITPAACVADLDIEWRNWQNGLSGQWTNAIKPIIPIADAYHPDTMPASDLTDFANALKTDSNPATWKGYKGIQYFRAGLENSAMRSAMAATVMQTTNAVTLYSIGAADVFDSGATIVWTTDISADSVVDFGLTTSYGTTLSNGTATVYHSLILTNLTAGTTYHYRVKSIDLAGHVVVSADKTFSTLSQIADIIIDNPAAAAVGSWSTGTGSADKYGTDYRYKSQGTGAAYFQFAPNILVAGDYKVYEWHPQGSNRSSGTPHIISYNGGSQTFLVNQQTAGGKWNLLGTFNFTAGAAGNVRITDGFSDAGQLALADAIKFVYVVPPPGISSQPQNQTQPYSGTATFTVTATGGTPLSYRWRKNGTALADGPKISGSGTASLTVSSLVSSDAGNYSVLITNSAGSITSSNATLTVQDPGILTQPANRTVDLGNPVTFTLGAAGTPTLGYQWRRNGSALSNGGTISGATTSALTISSTTLGDAGNYTAVVSNSIGSVTSVVAVLTVDASPAITGQPQSRTNLAGDTVNFTVVASGASPLAFQWRKNGVVMSNGGNISGATTSALTLANVGASDGASYTVVVSNSYGSETSAPPAVLSVIVPPSISTQPTSRTNSAGTVATFSVTASGGALAYQWRKDGVDLTNGGSISGATSTTLSLSGVTQADAASYTVFISNAAGSITSNPANLVVNDGTPEDIIIDNPSATVVGSWSTSSSSADKYGTDYRFRTGQGAAANYLQFIPNLTSASSYEVYEWHPQGGNRTTDAPHVIIYNGGSTTNYVNQRVSGGQWNLLGTYNFASGTGGSVKITDASTTLTNVMADAIRFKNVGAIAPQISSQPASRTNIVGTTASFSVLPSGTGPFSYQWRKNGVALSNSGNISGATTRSLVISGVGFANAGNYTVVISNVAGSKTSSAAVLTVVDDPPAIVDQPMSQTVGVGATANFTVSATGTSLTYQWKKNAVSLSNGGNISGANSANLNISNVQAGDAANYSVVISNSAANVTSSSAALTVASPPTITSNPTSQTNDSGATVNFIVSASGTGPLSYKWRKGGVDLVNGSNISGASTSSLTLNGVTIADNGSYTAVVSNPGGSVTSSPATLTVNPLPTTFDSIAILPDQRIDLFFSGEPGATNIIEISSDLSAWTNLATIVNTNGSTEFIDPATNLPVRFYRARIVP